VQVRCILEVRQSTIKKFEAMEFCLIYELDSSSAGKHHEGIQELSGFKNNSYLHARSFSHCNVLLELSWRFVQ
jgi:hypothetical protein